MKLSLDETPATDNQRLQIKPVLAWCIYDWGIAAFSSVVITFLFSTYFTTKIAKNPIIGTNQWGHALALAGLIIAILSPVFGAIADRGGHRKYWLAGCTFVLVTACALLWFAYPSPSYATFTLFCIVMGSVGYQIGMVFYNSLLTSLAPRNYLGRVSGWGWGLGYFGGLGALGLAFSGFVNANRPWLNPALSEQIRICGPLIAVWITVFAIPLFLMVPSRSVSHLKIKDAIQSGISDLFVTIKMMFKQKNILIFLIAQMIYIDGLNTIFAFGGIYAAGTLGLSLGDVLKLGILLNIFAGSGAIVLSWVDDLIGSKITILVSLLFTTLFGLILVLAQTKTQFWITASLFSLFVGAIQSSSRSLMALLIPKEKATELFGFYILSTKISAFLGPLLFAFIALRYNSQRLAMGSILIFFIIGASILLFVRAPKIVK